MERVAYLSVPTSECGRGRTPGYPYRPRPDPGVLNYRAFGYSEIFAFAVRKKQEATPWRSFLCDVWSFHAVYIKSSYRKPDFQSFIGHNPKSLSANPNFSIISFCSLVSTEILSRLSPSKSSVVFRILPSSSRLSSTPSQPVTPK